MTTMFKSSNLRLLVLSPLYPPCVGGLESHAQQFNREMSARGHQVTVFTPLVTSNTPLVEKEGKVRVYRFPAFEIIPNYPVPKFWLPLFWRQLKIVTYGLRITDCGLHPVIISRTRFFLTSIMALLVSKILRVPWLHIEHGSDYVHLNNPISNNLARLYDQTFGRLVFHSADALVANSKASAEFVKRLAPKREATVIYRGVDMETINRVKPVNLNSKCKLPLSSVIVTYCGRLIDGKGIHDLITALDNIREMDWHCFIIGEGPQQKSLQNQTRHLKLSDRITFLGEMPWEQGISYLKGSDIAVNPSYTEGLPSTVIEAALCRTAVVATNVGGTSEILPATSEEYLYTPKKTDELASRLKHLIENPAARRNLASCSFEAVGRKFHWKQSIDQYEQILQQL